VTVCILIIVEFSLEGQGAIIKLVMQNVIIVVIFIVNLCRFVGKVLWTAAM